MVGNDGRGTVNGLVFMMSCCVRRTQDCVLLTLVRPTLSTPSLKVQFGIWCPSCGNGAMSAELTLDVDTREIGAILKEAAFSVGFKEDMSHILNIRPDQVSKRYDIEICAVCYVPRYVQLYV